MKRLAIAVLLTAAGLFNVSAFAEEHELWQAPNEVRLCPPPSNVSLTAYNLGIGLIKDIRNLDLINGINLIRCEDIATGIDPTSVSLSCLSAPNTVSIKEQNFQYDLLNRRTILSKSIGKQVKFRRFLDSGGSEEITGTLLSSSSNVILKTPNGIILDPTGQIELSELPPDLKSKPSLLWKLEASKPGKQTIEIAYLTTGISWHCDYIFVVGKNGVANLDSWVTLNNQSGINYKNTNLKLVAGNVHITQPYPARNQSRMMADAQLAAASAPSPSQFTEGPLSDYHIYSLHNTIDVNENETKQLALFNAENITTKKVYVFDSNDMLYNFMPSSSDDADFKGMKVKLEFVNSADNNLGMALPAGNVRAYKRDADGVLQFIGEDQIVHTPKNEKVRLYLGDAIDIVGLRKQTNVEQTSPRVKRLSCEVTLRNHTDSDATVTDIEHEPNNRWKIVSSSMPYSKTDAHTFEFLATVPANGETKIDYTVEIRY